MVDDNKDKDTSLEDHGIFFLNDDIDDENCGKAITFILESNLNKKHNKIKLIINSHGGSCTSGFALVDVMVGSTIPVQTIGLGIIASMGLMIFIAGEKGTRTLTPNTVIMSHQYSSVFWGKEHELVAERIHQNLMTKKILSHYSKYTNLKSEKQIREKLLPPHEVYLTAQEAKKYGICDVIKLV
jgi:ATP-dependent Clp protease protease subunit